MSAARSRIARTALGAVCIAAATAALVWFAFQFTPGEPRARTADTEVGRSQASGGSRYAAESIADVAQGETLRVEGLTQGKGFSYSEEEIAAWPDEERERTANSDSWRYDQPALDLTVTGFKAMTDDAFIEWYPHYGDARIESSDAEAKVFLVELTVTNPNDEPARMYTPMLWSEDFNGASDNLGNGLHTDKYLLDELYGEPQDTFATYSIPDDWNVIQPGETRTFTVPFLVYEKTFHDPAAYDDIDPSRFCLALSDYDPPTVYRLWLG
ncbi:hypothetical protein [Eggerthella hominis]|uniref:hypothetical protein n=1 Tax=Eggerthella hominis TaxID=2763043 RepID=UPI0021047725|nr:hypothetical protein [Eggerthella hominis]